MTAGLRALVAHNADLGDSVVDLQTKPAKLNTAIEELARRGRQPGKDALITTNVVHGRVRSFDAELRKKGEEDEEGLTSGRKIMLRVRFFTDVGNDKLSWS